MGSSSKTKPEIAEAANDEIVRAIHAAATEIADALKFELGDQGEYVETLDFVRTAIKTEVMDRLSKIDFGKYLEDNFDAVLRDEVRQYVTRLDGAIQRLDKIVRREMHNPTSP